MTIYNHSSENMHEIQDQNAHLVVTSPPYPMIAKWDELFGVVDFEKQHKILDKVWKGCYRILVQGGIACINIGDATRTIKGKGFQCYPNFARITMAMSNIGFTPLIPIFWKKISNRPNAFLGSGMLPTNAYVSQDCEYIGIFRKGVLRKFEPKDEKRYASKFTKQQRDLWFRQIWQVKGSKDAKTTSAFPEEIPLRLVQMFSVIGDVVVDPFSGTGTTGRIAEQLGRKFVGYEIGG